MFMGLYWSNWLAMISMFLFIILFFAESKKLDN